MLFGPDSAGNHSQLSSLGRPVESANPWVHTMWTDLCVAGSALGFRDYLDAHGLLRVHESPAFQRANFHRLQRYDCTDDRIVVSGKKLKIGPWQNDFGFAVCVNKCPWCLRTFASVPVTRYHVRSAVIVDGVPKCPTKMTRPVHDYPLLLPKKLKCRICKIILTSIDGFLSHIVDHYRELLFAHGSTSESDSESTSTTTESDSSSSSSCTTTTSSTVTSSSQASSTVKFTRDDSHGQAASAVLGRYEGQGQGQRQAEQEGKDGQN